MTGMRTLTDQEVVDIVSLRRSGMTIPDVVLAMAHFRDAHIGYHQVKYVARKHGVARGPRPRHANDRILNSPWSGVTV